MWWLKFSSYCCLWNSFISSAKTEVSNSKTELFSGKHLRQYSSCFSKNSLSFYPSSSLYSSALLLKFVKFKLWIFLGLFRFINLSRSSISSSSFSSSKWNMDLNDNYSSPQPIIYSNWLFWLDCDSHGLDFVVWKTFLCREFFYWDLLTIMLFWCDDLN